MIVNCWLTVDEARRIYPLDRPRALRAAARRRTRTTRRPSGRPRRRTSTISCHLERTRFELAAGALPRRGVGPLLHPLLGHRLARPLRDRALPGRRPGVAGGLPAALPPSSTATSAGSLEHAADATVAVLSDHGQCEETHAVHVNGVLRELGLSRCCASGRRDVNAAAAGGEAHRDAAAGAGAAAQGAAAPAGRAGREEACCGGRSGRVLTPAHGARRSTGCCRRPSLRRPPPTRSTRATSHEPELGRSATQLAALGCHDGRAGASTGSGPSRSCTAASPGRARSRRRWCSPRRSGCGPRCTRDAGHRARGRPGARRAPARRDAAASAAPRSQQRDLGASRSTT